MPHKVLKVRVTLKGRPVRAYSFNQDVVTVGRDPGADIFLDNPGVSREHCKIDFTSSGVYRIQDVGSANGMFVNEQPVKVHFIINNDVVFIGKFALWFMYEDDRRGERDAAKRLARAPEEGTTVLKTSELQEMIGTIREAEAASTVAATRSGAPTSAAPDYRSTTMAPAAAGPAAMASTRMRSLVVLGLLLAFFAGYVAGGGLRSVPWHGAFGALSSRTQP